MEAAEKCYTVEVPGAPSIPGETKPRRHYLFADALADLLPGVPTVYDNFVEGVKRAGARPMLGTRVVTNGVAGPYEWQTYDEVFKRCQDFGSGLKRLSVARGANVGLFSVNRAEWVIAEQACFMQGLQTVPLYDTLGHEALAYIVNQTNMAVLVVTRDKVPLLAELRSAMPCLTTLVLMDAADASDVASAQAHGFECRAFADVERDGAAHPLEIQPPAREDVATICYTSGTTGLPKGVVLTHANLVSFSAGVTRLTERGRMGRFGPDDVYVSYLPLAHIFERACIVVMMYHGARIGFYQGDTLKLLEDIQELRPTVFASVPRLYNRIYDRITGAIAERGGLAQRLFNMAFAAKRANLAHGRLTHWLWDRIVFAKVQARLGGRVRSMFCGAAPISAHIVDFLRVCFACELIEGYGQTESTAGITVTDGFDLTGGHVGVVMPHNEVKLVDLPDMDYRATDPLPRGEVCVRGLNTFREYYKNPDQTAATVDKDGWVHTGDVGMWDARGRLCIIDRCKNIFKLAQGEYVAPERVENVLQAHPLVAQAFVAGDSMQACVVAVIVPDAEPFAAWARARRGAGATADLVELCRDTDLARALVGVLAEHGRAFDLKGFEIVKAVHLEPELFSVENNLLTPTFKLRRNDAIKRYAKEVEGLYSQLSG